MGLNPYTHRPATAEERRVDLSKRIRALEDAYANGLLSDRQYEERTAELGSFEGYPRPIQESQ